MTLQEFLKDPGAVSQLMREVKQDKRVYVLPAFVVHGKNYTMGAFLAESLAQRDKRTLQPFYEFNVVERFDPTVSACCWSNASRPARLLLGGVASNVVPSEVTIG